MILRLHSHRHKYCALKGKLILEKHPWISGDESTHIVFQRVDCSGIALIRFTENILGRSRLSTETF